MIACRTVLGSAEELLGSPTIAIVLKWFNVCICVIVKMQKNIVLTVLCISV